MGRLRVVSSITAISIVIEYEQMYCTTSQPKESYYLYYRNSNKNKNNQLMKPKEHLALVGIRHLMTTWKKLLMRQK